MGGITRIINPNSNKSITIEMADGSIIRRTGNRNWRNNNPGKLRVR